jgi:hydroxyacylglutathione hydrolase
MKLTDRIHQLQIDFEINLGREKKIPRFVNVLIIFGDQITLVDTGVKGSEEFIFRYIQQNHRRPGDIATIILSHSHPDHIGSAARIRELTHCRVLAHKGEVEWIENIEKQNNERPVPGFFGLVDHSVTVDKFLKDHQLIKADRDITLEVIHSPGHSKGSVNLFFKEDKIFFTADSIPLKGDIPNYDSFPDAMKTLEIMKKRKDDQVLLTSWTPPLTEKKEIDKLIHDGEEYLLTLDEIVRKTYLGEEPVFLDFCRAALGKLRLPPFLVTPLVDRAFRSHMV